MLIVVGVISFVISFIIGYNLGINQDKRKRKKESVDYFWEGRRNFYSL